LFHEESERESPSQLAVARSEGGRPKQGDAQTRGRGDDPGEKRRRSSPPQIIKGQIPDFKNMGIKKKTLAGVLKKNLGGSLRPSCGGKKGVPWKGEAKTIKAHPGRGDLGANRN